MRSLHVCLALACLSLCLACKPLYIPNTPNVPLFSEGDETQVGLTAGSNGYGATLGYSPYYGWAIVGGANTYGIPQDSNFALKYKHKAAEIGTGFYTRLSKFGRLESFVGAGIGKTGLDSDFDKYRKFWWQTSLGFSSQIMDVAITLRPVFVNHFEQRTTFATAKVSNNSFFIEPFLTFRAGYENIKFQLQGGYSIDLSGNIPSQNLVATFGIHLTFVKDFERYNWSP